MIAGGVDHSDVVCLEPVNLVEQEALSLERKAIAVEEVSCDQKSVDVFTNCEVDSSAERISRRFAQSTSDCR